MRKLFVDEKVVSGYYLNDSGLFGKADVECFILYGTLYANVDDVVSILTKGRRRDYVSRYFNNSIRELYYFDQKYKKRVLRLVPLEGLRELWSRGHCSKEFNSFFRRFLYADQFCWDALRLVKLDKSNYPTWHSVSWMNVLFRMGHSYKLKPFERGRTQTDLLYDIPTDPYEEFCTLMRED